MAEFPGLPAYEGALLDETPIPVGDGTNAREATMAMVRAYLQTQLGNSTPLVQWDGAGTTQFEDAQTPPDPLSNTGITDAALTFSGGALLLTASALAASSSALWVLDGTYALEDIEEIRMFLGSIVPSPGEEFMIGIAFMLDDAVGTCFTWLTGYDGAGAPMYALVRSDAPGSVAVATEAKGGTGYLTLKLNGTKPGGTFPAFGLQWEFVDYGGVRADGVTSSGYLDAVAPFTAAWDTSSCAKIGLILQSTAGAASGALGYIGEITVKRRQTVP